jgi:hypothetical protein
MVEITGAGRGVQAAFSPANGWEDRISRRDIGAARLRGYTLECGRLTIEEVPDPANPSQNFFELTASYSAIIEGSGLEGRAQTIRYNQAKSTVDLIGDVVLQKGDVRVSAARILYNIETGTFETEARGGIGFQ